jgi:hypothetical protein
MLLHQFILVLAAIARRFYSVLLSAVAVARRVASRVKLRSDLQET